jgi:transposase-like protein
MWKSLKEIRKTAKFLKVRPEQAPNTLRRFKKEIEEKKGAETQK